MSDPTGPGAILDVPFRSGTHEGLPVEVLDRQHLFDIHGHAALERYERLTFGMLLVVTGGSGRHLVDGEVVVLERGTVVLMLPGQVHRHMPDRGCDAVLVLWRPEAGRLEQSVVSSSSGPVLRVGESAVEALLALIAEIDRDVQAFDASVPATRALHALLEALLWRTERLAVEAGALFVPGQHHHVYRSFRAQLERRVTGRPTVAGLAAELGWSTRTLTRACREATGRSAKDLIDERVVLKARHLLLHTSLTVAAVGRRVGYPDPVRFGAWFRRIEGVSPGAFRQEHVGPSAPSTTP